MPVPRMHQVRVARITDDQNARPFTPPVTADDYAALLRRCGITRPAFQFAQIRWYRSSWMPSDWFGTLPPMSFGQAAWIRTDTAIVMAFALSVSRTLAEHEMLHAALDSPAYRDSIMPNGATYRLQIPDTAVHPPRYFNGVCAKRYP